MSDKNMKITTDDYSDEVFDFEGLNMLKDMKNKFMKDMRSHTSSNLIMDTAGSDYFFITYFVNDEMHWDLDRIEEDFMKHCGDKIHELAKVQYYPYSESKYTSPRESHQSILVSLMLNGAKSGDEYCIALIKYLFKTYYKSMYKQLKKFSRISADEIFALCDVGDAIDNGMVGIVLTMCLINKIVLCDNCELIFKNLIHKKEEYEAENDEFSDIEAFENDEFVKSTEIVEEWVTKDEKENPRFEKQNKVYWKEQKFVEGCLRHFGYPEDFIYQCMENNMGLKIQFTRTLAVLMKLYPNREFTFEEVQRYAVLYDAVAAFTDVCEEYDYVHKSLFGLETIYGFCDDETLFNPENIVVSKSSVVKAEEKRPLTNIVVKDSDEISKEEYLAEINELRTKLSQSDKECKYLKHQCASMNASRKETESLLAKFENDREELIALREFVYNQNQSEPKFDNITVDDMKAAIVDKNLVVIGGHVNWINKLKQEFPNWTYISPSNFKTFDASVLDKKDKLFFFTDYISHTAYGKFVKIARERKIPFSYLHGVNMEQVIKQIYESGE